MKAHLTCCTTKTLKSLLHIPRQDVALLAKLDDKLKFIDSANVLAHANTVLLQTSMGAVAVTEQLQNEAHKRGFIIPTRPTENPSARCGCWCLCGNVLRKVCMIGLRPTDINPTISTRLDV